MTNCGACRSWCSLTGHAGICMEQWKHVDWTAAVPMMPSTGTCDQFAPRVVGEQAPREHGPDEQQARQEEK